jgi:hypothetical protein
VTVDELAQVLRARVTERELQHCRVEVAWDPLMNAVSLRVVDELPIEVPRQHPLVVTRQQFLPRYSLEHAPPDVIEHHLVKMLKDPRRQPPDVG